MSDDDSKAARLRVYRTALVDALSAIIDGQAVRIEGLAAALNQAWDNYDNEVVDQSEVVAALRTWLAALDASEDDGEDEASVDTGRAVYVALAKFDARPGTTAARDPANRVS